MRRTSKKIILSLIITTIIAMLMPTNVQAAGTYSLSKSSASLDVGKTTTITVTTSNCEGKFSVSSSDTSVATVSTSSFWGDEKGATITITAKSAGSATITITPIDVTDTDLNDVTATRTCKVTVTKPTPSSTNTGSNSGSSSSSGSNSSSGSSGSSSSSSSNNSSSSSSNSSSSSSSNSSSSNKPSSSTNNTTTVKKSSNSKLSSLQIVEGVISPEFSSSVTEYTISVPNEIEKLSISAVADDSKATVKITGNEELKVGDNNIELAVTAEDGSKTTYKILAKRAEPALRLQTLTVAYINENGEKVDLVLNPVFSFDVYEYAVDTVIPNIIKNLEIVGTANRENAIIEIIGNEELQAGENVITVKVTVTDEAGLEEQKTYIIKVKKEEVPVAVQLTTMDKIKNWFNGAGSTISVWFTENFNKIITGMLLFVTVAFVGLTIYCVNVYKKYKHLLEKVAELNKYDLMERANVALNPENAKNKNIEDEQEDIYKINNELAKMNLENQEQKLGKGRRFK